MKRFLWFCLLMSISFSLHAFDGGWMASLPTEAIKLVHELETSSSYLSQMQANMKSTEDAKNIQIQVDQATVVIQAFGTFSQNYQQYKKERDSAERQHILEQLKIDISHVILLCSEAVQKINASLAQENSYALVIQGFAVRGAIDALKNNLSLWTFEQNRLGS